MKKILALVLVCLMVVGLFAGCQAAAKTEEITLKVWAPQEDQGDDTKWLNQMLKKFEDAHPEYKITWDLGVCSEGEAATTVGTDPSAAADVFMYANDQIGGLVEAGALAQLGGDYLKQVQDGVSATYLASVTYNNKVYGFPMTCNTWFMYYNKKLLSEEDVKSLEAMLEKGVVAFPVTTAWYNGAFFLGNGGTLFGTGSDAAAGIQFGGEAGYAAAKKMAELMQNKNFKNDADGFGNSGLKNGSVAAYFDGSWNYAGLYEALGEDLGAVALPTANIGGKDVSLKSLAGSKCVGVNPHSKNAKAAMQLASFLAGEESQLARFEIRGITPALTKLAENEKIKASICAQAEIAVMAGTSVVQPGLPEMGNFWTAMGTFGENMNTGKITVDNAKEMVDKLMESLNDKGL